MVKATLITSLLTLSATTLAIPTSLRPRADQPDEVIVLIECDNGKQGTQFKIQDRVDYFKDDYARRLGSRSDDTVLQSKITDPGRHDGMYYHVDWSAGTINEPVSLTFPKTGHKFKVWSLPADGGKGVPVNQAVEGNADFDGAPFKCYKDNQPWTTSDGYKCRAAYSCTRRERFIHRTNVLLDNSTVKVGEAKCNARETVKPINAKEAFAKLKEAAKKPFDLFQSFPIGGNGCKISFPTLTIPSSATDHFNASTPDTIADILMEQVGALIEQKRTTVKTKCRYNGRPRVPGEPNPSEPYEFTIEQEQLIYPRGGQFNIQLAQQSAPKWDDQTVINWRIDCPCHDDFKFLTILKDSLAGLGGFANPALAAKWISPMFGLSSAGVDVANVFTKC